MYKIHARLAALFAALLVAAPLPIRAQTDASVAGGTARAWSITLGNPDVVIADLDTGVRFDHPDLLAVAAGGKLLPGYDMISNALVANDGDGRDADATDPGDGVTAAEAGNRSGPFR